MNHKSSLGMDIKAVCALIYLIPVAGSLFFLILDFQDREIRLHALLALYVAIAVALCHLVLGLFAMIPFLGILFQVVIWIMYILYAMLMVAALAKALNGDYLRIPFFFDMASRGCN